MTTTTSSLSSTTDYRGMAFEAPRDLLALVVRDDDMRRTPKPVIVNVVATYSFANPSINTELLTMRLPGIGFNPRRFAAAKMRLPRPMTLAFCGGCAVCPGSRSVMDARLAALRFVDYQLRSGEYVQYRRFRVQNIVMSVWVPFELDLTRMIAEWSSHAEYTPSRFPGASFRFGCGSGIIVFNVFVTGRVVITRSRNEQHSYRAWYWFYTNVLVRHQLGTSAGTTSSSTYRMASARRSDTFASDVDRIASRHLQRRDGPMARSSEYAAYIGYTPRTSSVHAPATVRHAMADASPSVGGVLVDPGSHFLGHSAACPYICVSASKAPARWYEAYTTLELDDELERRRHDRAGCACISREQHMEQLRAAIGPERLDRMHGDAAPFADHTLACPFVCAASNDEWAEERDRLEAALCGVDVEGYTLEAALKRHRIAGCLHDNDVVGGDDDDIARAYISQLHAALNDVHEHDDVDATNAANHDGPLDIDDIIDYEKRYRLDALRSHTLDDVEPLVFELGL